MSNLTIFDKAAARFFRLMFEGFCREMDAREAFLMTIIQGAKIDERAAREKVSLCKDWARKYHSANRETKKLVDICLAAEAGKLDNKRLSEAIRKNLKNK